MASDALSAEPVINLDQMLQSAIRFARKRLVEDGDESLIPTFRFLNAAGEERVIACEVPTPALMVRAARPYARAFKAKAVAFRAEAWAASHHHAATMMSSAPTSAAALNEATAGCVREALDVAVHGRLTDRRLLMAADSRSLPPGMVARSCRRGRSATSTHWTYPKEGARTLIKFRTRKRPEKITDS